MPHIALPSDLPGILGLLSVSTDTAKPLLALADQLLHVDTPGLSRADRELIASYVSYLNNCVYCYELHAALADHHSSRPGWSRSVWNDSLYRNVSRKMRALLVIAGKIQGAPRGITNEDIASAHASGSSDRDIHDVVLIAAAFCMYNRYVDGLATNLPTDAKTFYETRARKIAAEGYARL